MAVEKEKTTDTEASKVLGQLDQEIARLTAEAEAAPLSASVDQSFYKLVDTDRARRSLRSDKAMYNPEKDGGKGGFTRKGRRYLEAINKIDNAQQANNGRGYRFVPTQSGKFAVLDPTGEPLSVKDSPVQGHSNMDRGLIPLLSGDSAAHKAVSNVMHNVINSDFFVEDPAYTKAQEEFEVKFDLADQVRDLITKRNAYSSFYEQGKLDALKDKSTTPGGTTSGQTVPGDEAAPGQEAPIIDGITDEEIQEGLENLEQGQFEEVNEFNFGLDLDSESLLDLASLSALSASIFTKGKTSTMLMGAAGIGDTISAALSPDRNAAYAGMENLGMLAFSMIGLEKKNKVKAVRRIASAFSKNPRNIVKLAGKFHNWASKLKNVVRVGAGLGALTQTIDQLAELRRKYETGEQITERDAMRLLYSMTQVFIVAKGTKGAFDKARGKSPKVSAKTADTKKAATPAKTVEKTATPKKTPDWLSSGKAPKSGGSTTSPTARKPVSGTGRQSTRGVNPNARRSNPNARKREKGGIIYEVHPTTISEFGVRLQKFARGGRLIPKAQTGSLFSVSDIANAFVPVETTIKGNVPYASGMAPNVDLNKIYGTEAITNAFESGYPGMSGQVVKAGMVPYAGGLEPARGLSETSWNLSEDPVDIESLPFIYKVEADDNWRDVRDSGAAPSGIKKTFYLDKNNENDLIAEVDLDAYLRKNYSEEWDDYLKKQAGTNTRSPILSSTGVLGAIPYGTISSLILNEISRKNVKNVEYADLKKTPVIQPLVFAPKSMPFEVQQAQRNYIEASALSAERSTASSDPIMNRIASLRINRARQSGLTEQAAREAQWNLDQINRTEDQQIAAQDSVARQRARQIDIENQNIQGRMHADNINAEMEVNAKQQYLNNIGQALQGMFDFNITKSNAIANAEYNANMQDTLFLQQQYQAELGREGGPDPQELERLANEIRVLGDNAVTAERLRQSGSRIFVKPAWLSKAPTLP